MSLTTGKIKKFFRSAWEFLANPHLLICLALAWMITNGWSYLFIVFGFLFHLHAMTAIGTAYLAMLWFPFTPEKLITIALAIILLNKLFPKDRRTLVRLKAIKRKALFKWHHRKHFRGRKEIT